MSRLLALSFLLTACGDAAPRGPVTTVAPEGAIELAPPVAAGEIDMGGDMPREAGRGFRSHAEWHGWAVRAWPEACARLRTVVRTGRIAAEGRTCAVTVVAGIVPVAQVVAGGTLIAAGERLDVGWTWTSLDPNRACAEDPVGTGERRFRLTRSRERQRWRATPLPVAPPFEDDPVRATCNDLPAFLDPER